MRGWRGDRTLLFALILPALGLLVAAERAILALLPAPCMSVDSDPRCYDRDAAALWLVANLGESLQEFAVLGACSFAWIALLIVVARQRIVVAPRVFRQAALGVVVATVGTLSCTAFYGFTVLALAEMLRG